MNTILPFITCVLSLVFAFFVLKRTWFYAEELIFSYTPMKGAAAKAA
ncbi:hypothetical protein ACFLSW_04675 [Candidatus Bipolaricaulota bacterium]